AGGADRDDLHAMRRRYLAQRAGEHAAGGRAARRQRAAPGGAGARQPLTRERPLEPLALLDELPVRVLVEDLVAAELVEIAAPVVEPLAVGAGAGDHPYGHRPRSRDELVDVIPAHVGDDLEAVGED